MVIALTMLETIINRQIFHKCLPVDVKVWLESDIDKTHTKYE